MSPDKADWLTQFSRSRYLWCSPARTIWYSERSIKSALRELGIVPEQKGRTSRTQPYNFRSEERRIIAEMLENSAKEDKLKRLWSDLNNSDNELEESKAPKRPRRLSPDSDVQEDPKSKWSTLYGAGFQLWPLMLAILTSRFIRL
jgi:hypothetical protein